jgi:hypothetical protein
MLLLVGDNPERIRSEAALAKLCGVCPIPASSGKTSRHRLNRGGDRQANAAVYRVVIVRRIQASCPCLTGLNTISGAVSHTLSTGHLPGFRVVENPPSSGADCAWSAYWDRV